MSRYYVYCVVKAGDFTACKWRGIELSAITKDEVSLVISQCPPQHEMITDSFAALHAELLDDLVVDYPLLPVRFGTLLESADKGQELLAIYYTQFTDLLKKLEGKVEMGLRALWQYEDGGKSEPDNSSGKAYLLARFAQDKQQKLIRDRAQSIGTEISAQFSWAQNIKVRFLVTPKLFYNAAILIKREECSLFWQRVDELKSSFPNLKFLASGPWPAYNFASISTGEVPACQLK